MAKQSLSVTLEPKTVEHLKRMAAEEYRNVSNMIDYIVAQYVLMREERNTTKIARASLLGKQTKPTPFHETEAALRQNMRIDEADLSFLSNS